MDDPFDPWFGREPRTPWTVFRAFYQRSLPPLMLIGILGWLVFVHFLRPPHPPIGAYIGGLAFLVAVVTIWPPESNWSKAAWLAVFFALTELEVSTLYEDRLENQEQQANTRVEERNAFKAIADGITTSIRNNQSAFDATMSRMGYLGKLSAKQISETTGGDSFCYVNIGGLQGGGLVVDVAQKGRYPLFQVSITIIDLDAFDDALKARRLDDLGAFRRSFPVIDFLTRATLWHPLATYPMAATSDYRRFNVQIIARNGGFTELLRIHRLKDGGLKIAQLVSASYFSTRQGIVLEQINSGFPVNVLKEDRDWVALKKLKPLSVQE